MKHVFMLLFCLAFSVQAQDSTQINQLNEVVVKSTRASEKSGMVFSTVTKKEIRKQNLGQDIPFLLNQLPSVVVTSDAGAGIGYTGIRIRGSDATRVNVTLNGVPYNDSESQGVFWVNMPDFASSIQSMQVQRGVGSSTNGAGAFGGSININTLGYEPLPTAETNFSVGSFGTLKNNILASTGLIDGKFVVDARLSRIVSDGFLNRSASNLRSFYVSGGYYFKDNFIRLNVFSGHEVTQQAWEGTPEALAKGDQAGIRAYVDRNGLGDAYLQRMLSEGRRFNHYTYDNQVDNYQQDHYQLISSFKIHENWRFNPTLHYTYGRGFYEQFRVNDRLSRYGIAPVVIGNQTISRSDLIRRKWLNNDFYGAVWSFDYTKPGPLSATFGGGWNQYLGDHFGEVIWARFASTSNIRQRWYENLGTKQDFNTYAKATYDVSDRLSVYGDLQYRRVGFQINGSDDNDIQLNTDVVYHFFNPKAGLTYQLNDRTSAFLSYAKGSREPSRQDFVDGLGQSPRPETLHDFEAGYKFQKGKAKTEVTLYYMHYRDQLVLTGQVNDVGNAIRINVPVSYRAGIEWQGSMQVGNHWVLGGNATFSQNKIRNFSETIVSYDETPTQVNSLTDTDISFSPNVIAGGQMSYLPAKNIEITWMPKYVGRQFLDNTSSASRQIDAFFVNDVRMNWTVKSKIAKEITFSLLVNNVLNHVYEANGYTYSYIAGGVITENFLYPQAGRNFLAAVRLKW